LQFDVTLHFKVDEVNMTDDYCALSNRRARPVALSTSCCTTAQLHRALAIAPAVGAPAITPERRRMTQAGSRHAQYAPKSSGPASGQGPFAVVNPLPAFE
jgi:hypothetical protein